MADICQFVCPYRTPSGYCGSTGGYTTCPHRKMYEPPTMKSAEPIKPMTNADKYFRNATDEEIAKWIHRHDCHINLYGYDHEEAILDWLKQEVRDD